MEASHQHVIRLVIKNYKNLTNLRQNSYAIRLLKIFFNVKLNETAIHYFYRCKNLGIVKMSRPNMEELINKLEMNAIKNSYKFEKFFNEPKRIKNHLY